MEHCKRKVSYCDASYITHHVYVTHARVLSSWIIKFVSAAMNLPTAPLPRGYAVSWRLQMNYCSMLFPLSR